MTATLIETFTGRHFRPLSPRVKDVHIEDIAHALSNQCRFSGHVKKHYSVAEHSVRVSRLLQAYGQPPEIQLWGLLHDASEAYLVDIPSPLKHTPVFKAYRAAEKRLQAAICERFGLPKKHPKQVKLADAILLATEARDLMAYTPAYWAKLKAAPLETKIAPWTPGIAEESFLLSFYKLYEGT